jgi:hypothetical protein
MADIPNAPSEVIGFEESEGRLYLRLRSGAMVVVDAHGAPLPLNDASIRKCLSLKARPAAPIDNEEAWNPWRQGP